MKILMLGWELPPFHTGGMGVACFQLAQNLAAYDNEIDFVLPYKADFGHIDFMRVVSASKIEYHEFILHILGIYDSTKYVNKSTLNRFEEQYIGIAVNEARNNNYDVIHAHDWLTLRAGMQVKLEMGIPLIAHIHATEFDRAGGKSGNPLIHEIEYLGLQMADGIVAVSQATKDILVQKYDLNPDKIHVIHNAMDEVKILDIDNRTSSLQKLKNAGFKLVLSAGRLTVQKGLINLLNTFKLVVEKCPEAILIVVGSGEQEEELIGYSAELGLAKNVIFAGYLNGSGAAWREIFAISDVFVLPSISEPFGLTPLESIYHGTPVVLSKQSGVSEVIHSCFKSDFWDAYDMANNIISLLTYPDLNKLMHDNSLNEVRTLSWKKQAGKIVDIYTNIREMSHA